MELSEITLEFGAVGVKHVCRDEVTSLKYKALDSSVPVLWLAAPAALHPAGLSECKAGSPTSQVTLFPFGRVPLISIHQSGQGLFLVLTAD